MKKLCLSFIVICSTFFLSFMVVNANTINTMDMDIQIDEYGNAHVTEVWDVDLNQGTEGYKPYYNMGVSTISDFTVTDGDNTYTAIDYWDVDASFDQKKFKNGIVHKSNGVELCWGISSYGHHAYKLEYTINNFIYKTKDDYQMLYWTLIPYELSSKPGNVTIRVYSDKIKEDDISVWAYGKYGAPLSYYNGYIELDSNGVLQSKEYMTLLVKFPKDSFEVSSQNLGKTFDEYYEMAEDGARHYSYKKPPLIFVIISVLLPFLPFILIMVLAKCLSKYPTLGTKHIDYGSEKKKMKKKYSYFRELPFDGDLFSAYWASQCYSLGKKKTDFLGALLLKWTKEKVVEVKTISKEGIFKKENTTIVFLNKELLTNDLEKELYDMMYEASKDGILETKEFERWCNVHYSKILRWFDKIIDQQTERLHQEEKLDFSVQRVLKIFKFKVYGLTSSIKDEAEKLDGLKRFFKDFSNLAKTHPIEVHMWEEYLMYAQILGMAEQVAKDFKKLYPDEISDLSVNEAMFIHDISHSGMRRASAASASASSHSSGGGGGGSFGGGGGGGGFR